MPQIDRARLVSQASHVFANAGEAATLRRFVSASVGTPKFGVATQYNYTTFTVTGLFYERRMPVESLVGGGITTQGKLYVSLQSEISQRDEIIWRGTAYRVDGMVTPENIGGRFQWKAPLEVAGRTGL